MVTRSTIAGSSTAAMNDGLEDGTLFDIERPAISLADRFVEPPFSLLDRRKGDWQDRKRRWLASGVERDAIGREDGLTYGEHADNEFGAIFSQRGGTTSVFDPVVAELAYRWFSCEGDAVLDPFCGGAVRGLVAGALGRRYSGVDVRQAQLDANEEARQGRYVGQVEWLLGDATKLLDTFPLDVFDLAFTCPPYAYLERYSDQADDISTYSYSDFAKALRESLWGAYQLLDNDRFCVYVLGDARQQQGDGRYEGLIADCITAARDVGFGLYNYLVTADPVGSAPARASRLFDTTRKVVKSHQDVLVFVKGDGKAAGKRVIG